MRLSLLLALSSLSGCEIVKSCTEIGCINTLTITVTADGAGVPEVHGTITVGSTTYDVACLGGDNTGSSPEVTCAQGGVVSISVSEADGGGVVSWALAGADPVDTGDWGYDGTGSTTPAWESSEPNGEGCPPVCWAATMEIALDVLD